MYEKSNSHGSANGRGRRTSFEHVEPPILLAADSAATGFSVVAGKPSGNLKRGQLEASSPRVAQGAFAKIPQARGVVHAHAIVNFAAAHAGQNEAPLKRMIDIDAKKG